MFEIAAFNAAGLAAAQTGSTPSAAPAAGFAIVENGAARAIIVAGDDSSLVAQFAAQELQWHIEKATGVRLEIVSEKEAANSPFPQHIYVGPSAATEKAGVRADDLPQNRMIGTDFDSLVGMWGVQGINLYMMGRPTAHPEMSVDEVLNDQAPPPPEAQ